MVDYFLVSKFAFQFSLFRITFDAAMIFFRLLKFVRMASIEYFFSICDLIVRRRWTDGIKLWKDNKTHHYVNTYSKHCSWMH